MSLPWSIIFRRIGSCLVDWTIEVAGGVLGSYFGVMLAALTVAMKDGPAEEMQSSMLSGLGFGFIFWTLSISFLNRVLIQGVSRASIGKKVFKLELISTTKPLDWSTVITRWLVSFVSLNFAGLGYAYLFFDSEGRTLHDLIAHTDVVPIYEGSSMSVEASGEAANLSHFKTPEPMGRRIILLQPTLADVIEIRTPIAAQAEEIEKIEEEEHKKAA